MYDRLDRSKGAARPCISMSPLGQYSYNVGPSTGGALRYESWKHKMWKIIISIIFVVFIIFIIGEKAEDKTVSYLTSATSKTKQHVVELRTDLGNRQEWRCRYPRSGRRKWQDVSPRVYPGRRSALSSWSPSLPQLAGTWRGTRISSWSFLLRSEIGNERLSSVSCLDPSATWYLKSSNISSHDRHKSNIGFTQAK